MKHKSKTRRKTLFQTSKRRRPHLRTDGVLARGEGMGVGSDLLSIIEIMLKDMVRSGESISLIMDDGRLAIIGETSGIDLCEASDEESE